MDRLRKAREGARRFVAAPEYRTGAGLRFSRGNHGMTSYDGIGEPAMAIIKKIKAIGFRKHTDKLVFFALTPNFLSLRDQSADWSWQSPYLEGKCTE